MYRLLCFFLIGGWATPAISQSITISDVTIVDVSDGSLLPGQTVVVDGNRIESISPSNDSQTTGGAVVVDGSGGYLIPGLWDMHVHTFNNNAPQPPNTWSFPLYLANGVTGVRDMWVKPGESSEQLQAWRRGKQEGTFVGPRFGAVGTLVDGVPPVQPGADTLSTAGDARAYVARLKDAGIDFVKVYSRLTPEVYQALAEAAQETSLYLAGHGPNSLSSFEVVAAGQRSIEHLTGIHETCSSREDSLRTAGVQAFGSPGLIVSTFDAEKCETLYEQFAENETWQVPTLITNRVWTADARFEALRQDEGLLYTPTWEAAEWEWVQNFLSYTPPIERQAYNDLYKLEQRIVSDMHAAGVPLLAGTDFGNPYIYPGFSLLDELEEFVSAGISPLASLQTATLNPARYLNRMDDLGTIAPGKLADFVLLDANPLDDINNVRRIRAVVANGILYTHDELEQMKHEVLASHYREALDQPPSLTAQEVEDEVLQKYTGAYQQKGRDSQAEVVLEAGRLSVIFGDWVDPLEPLGGALFRVPGTSVLYVFHTDHDGSLWSFEVNDGDDVVQFRRTDIN